MRKNGGDEEQGRENGVEGGGGWLLELFDAGQGLVHGLWGIVRHGPQRFLNRLHQTGPVNLTAGQKPLCRWLSSRNPLELQAPNHTATPLTGRAQRIGRGNELGRQISKED